MVGCDYCGCLPLLSLINPTLYSMWMGCRSITTGMRQCVVGNWSAYILQKGLSGSALIARFIGPTGPRWAHVGPMNLAG